MKPIQTAISSFGMSGRVFHAPFLTTHAGFDFYAVVERSKDEAQKLYPHVKQYRSYADMLSDSAIELVVVNTPNILHYLQVREALLAGKHVICEKPFTVSTDEAEELIQLAEKNNLCLSVYHNRRYDSDFKTISEVVQKNLLGILIEAEFHFDRFRKEISPKKHKEEPMPGTGALYDLGSHLIDQALVLFGMPGSVYADIECMRPVSLVDDYFELLLYYPKFRVRLKGSYQVRESLPGYILHGDKGSFIKPKTDLQETQLQQGMLPDHPQYGIEPEAEQGILHTEIQGKVVRNVYPSHKGNYISYYDEMYDCIREGKPAPVAASAAKDVITVIEAARKSHETGRRIYL